MIVRKAEANDAEGLTKLGTAVGSEPEGWLVTTNGSTRESNCTCHTSPSSRRAFRL